MPDRLAMGKGFQHVDEVESRLVKKMVHRSRGAPPDRLASERLKPLRENKKTLVAVNPPTLTNALPREGSAGAALLTLERARLPKARI